MIAILIMLAEAVKKFGTVTEASMYQSGLIAISGVAADGSRFSVTYQTMQENENAPA